MEALAWVYREVSEVVRYLSSPNNPSRLVWCGGGNALVDSPPCPPCFPHYLP